MPTAVLNDVAERIPDARLHTIAGKGHLFFIAAPAETLRVLEGFLGE